MTTKSKIIKGVRFSILKCGVKAMTKGKRGAYFVGNFDLESITSVYRKYMQQALDYFGPRLHSFPGKPLDKNLLKEIAVHATLHTMYLDHATRSPFQISEDNWETMMVRIRVEAIIQQRWPRNKGKAAAVTAHLFGYSREQYANWVKGVERFMDRR